MPTLVNLRDEVRQRIGETSTTHFTNAQINAVLNEAQRDFASMGGIVEADTGYSLVANQYLYTAPANYINSRYLLFEEDTKLRYVTHRELFNFLRAQPDSKGDPDYWSLWDREIRVFPTPSASADSTTLNGAVASGDATITVVSTAGFPTSGRIKINNEEIQYYNTDATNFLQCRRGMAGTTAASHSDTDPVNELNLRLFYYKDPDAMSVDADTPEIPQPYHDVLIYYAASMLKNKDMLYDQAQYFMGIYMQKKAQAHAEIKMRQRDRSPRMLPGDRGRRGDLGAP